MRSSSVAALALFAACLGATPTHATEAGAEVPAAPGRPAQAEAADPTFDEPADPSISLVRPLQTIEDAVAVWNLWRKAVAAGDRQRADQLLGDIREYMVDSGARRMSGFAFSLLRHAERLVEADRSMEAVQAVEAAAALAPGLPEVAAVGAAVERARSPLAVHKWAYLEMRAGVLRIADFERRMLAFSDLIVTGFIVVGLFGLLFVCAQLIRYALPIFYDLGMTFPAWMRALVIALAVLTPLVPIYFGFGPLLLVAPLVVLLWGYQDTTERVASVVLVLMIGAAPWLLRVVDHLSAAGTGTSQALYNLSLDPGDSRALELAEGAVHSDPNDWLSRAYVGLAYKRRGDFDDAAALLQEAARLGPSDGPVASILQNNLAVALLASGRDEMAERGLTRARRGLQGRAEPVFNLARLYQRQGRIEDAQGALQEATSLDQDRVVRWNEDADLNANRYLRDLPLPESLLFKRVLGEMLEPTTFAQRAWLVLAGPVPEAASPAASLVALLLVAILGVFRNRIALSQPCARCANRVTEVPSARRGHRSSLCEQCDNLFVKNVPTDRRIRFEKEVRIARYQSLVSWGTRVGGLVPGFAELIRGHALRGAVTIAIFAAIVIRIFLPQGVLYEPAPEGLGGEIPAMLWAAAVLVLIGLSIARSWQLARRPG